MPLVSSTAEKRRECLFCFEPLDSSSMVSSKRFKDLGHLADPKNGKEHCCSALIHMTCLIEWCKTDNSCPHCQFTPALPPSLLGVSFKKIDELPTNPTGNEEGVAVRRSQEEIETRRGCFRRIVDKVCKCSSRLFKNSSE